MPALTSSNRGLSAPHDAKRKSRGQSIVEFAIILPVLLLMVLAALDLGRAFLGWVVLNNAARVGANYAALHPDAWGTPGDSADQATYSSLVADARDDASIALSACNAAVPSPAFPTGTDIGDFSEVVLECDFNPITPIIGDLFTGGTVTVSARSVFPIRSGLIAGAAVTPPPSCLTDFTWAVDSADSLTYDFTDATPPTATGWIWDFGDTFGSAVQDPSHTYSAGGTYTVELQSYSNGTYCSPREVEITVVEPPPSPDPDSSPEASPSADPSPSVEPSPTPGCEVPSFIGERKNDAQQIWDDEGFTTTVELDPDANQNQNWYIQFQSLVAGQGSPCNSPIVISPDATGPG